MTAKIAFWTFTAMAEGGNLNALIAVAADVTGEYCAAQIFLAKRPNKWRLFFCAWLDDRLIGCATLSRPGPEHSHLHHFLVLAAERNSEHGKHKVTKMVARCHTVGDDTLALQTLQDNRGVIRLYIRFGFAETGAAQGHNVMTQTL